MSASQSRINLRPEALLLAVAAFLAPVIGGHVATDAQPIYDGLLGEILGGGALPLTARLLLAIFPLAAFALALKHRVVQIPNLRLLGILAGLVVMLATTIVLTDFRYVAFREWQTWLIYASTFLATITIAGRQKNVRLFLAAIGAGTTVVALKGIGEYASMMAKEPTYRIFADWNNPNAVASMLVLGTLVLLGLALSEENRNRWIAMGGASFCTVALILTQSKGGYLAFAVGLFALLVFQIAFKQAKKIAVPLVPIAVGVVLALALGQAAQAQSKGGQALARITESGSTVEQSAGFRQNLWKTALDLAQENPMGVGVGTFRYYSARPGLTDQTVFAHQTYLQVLAEGGVVSLGLLLAFAAFWFYLVTRGSRVQPENTLALKAGVLAAVVGFGAHGMVESNLSFFGTGLCFFIVLALGLQLATDGTSPEAMPPGVRGTVAAIFCAIPFLAVAMSSMAEIKKATFRTAMENRDPELMAPLAEELPGGTFGDPEGLYLASFAPRFSPDPNRPARQQKDQLARMDLLDQVAKTMPTPMYLRAAARQALLLEEPDRALAYLDELSRFDPSNLPAGELRLEILDNANRIEEAKQAARDLIAMEQSVSYQIRAIPEMIPTSTFDARIYLASQETDIQTKADLLQQAVDGYIQYREVTVAKLEAIKKQLQEANRNATVEDRLAVFATENLEEAKQKLGRAREAAEALAQIYSDLGNPEAAQKAQEAIQKLQP